MRRLLGLCVIVPLVLLSGLTASAQEGEMPSNTLAPTYEIQVKSGHQMEFENAITEHFAMHSAANDPWRRDVWQVVAGPNLGRYFIRSGGHTWEELDQEAEVPNDNEHIATVVLPHIESVSSKIINWMPSVSTWPPDMEPPKMADVTTYTLSYDGVEGFMNVLKKFHKMILEKESPLVYAWGEVMVGAPGPQLILALPRDGWADFKPPEPSVWGMLAEAYGEHDAKIMRATIGDAIVSKENFVSVYRRDLSHVPE